MHGRRGHPRPAALWFFPALPVGIPYQMGASIPGAPFEA